MNRPVLHVGVEGLSGKGKTLYTSYLLLLYWQKSYSLYSNYRVIMPHTYIDSIETFNSLAQDYTDKVACFDDFERDMSSKYLRNKDKEEVISVMLDFRKFSTRCIFSCKRFEEIDKSLRAIADWLVSIELEFNPQFLSKLPDLDVDAIPMKYCMLHYVERPWFDAPIAYEGYLFDLDLIAQLYDTRERVSSFRSGVGGTPDAIAKGLADVNIENVSKVDKYRKYVLDSLDR